jgi:hypothetical protein
VAVRVAAAVAANAAAVAAAGLVVGRDKKKVRVVAAIRV